MFIFLHGSSFGFLDLNSAEAVQKCTTADGKEHNGVKIAVHRKKKKMRTSKNNGRFHKRRR